MILSDLPFLKNCYSKTNAKKYRTTAFITISIVFIAYTVGIIVHTAIQNQIINLFTFIFIAILLIVNLALFVKLNHYDIWKYTLIVLISFIVVLRSTPFTSNNFSSLLIATIPLIAYSICERKNAAIITIIFFILSFIVFVQKLFLNYYNPDNFLISFYLVILYIIVGGLTMFLSYIEFKNASYYENSIIKEKNLNTTNTEIIKKFIHELRTSVNNIVAITDFLGETHTNPKQKEYLETIITSVNTILSATKKLDVFSNSSEMQLAKEKQTFDIAETVGEFLKIYADSKKEKQFYFTINVSKLIPKNLIGIPEKLKQILFNIFETIASNTESYKVDVDLSLSTQKETDSQVFVRLEIHTSSIQVNALDVEFDKNYARLNNYFSNKSIEIPEKDDKEYESNYNIILAKNIVNHLNGEIGISFKDPNIIVFWMALPLWKKGVIQPEQDQEEQATGAYKDKTEKKLNDIRVLVVEDNHLNQRVLVLGLKSIVKELDIANNGREAIEMFTNSKYDIILMDLHLPVIDGFKATEKIREIESGLNTHTPIIGLSAILMDGIQEQCKNAGIDEYISKPYNISKLTERIEYYIHR